MISEVFKGGFRLIFFLLAEIVNQVYRFFSNQPL